MNLVNTTIQKQERRSVGNVKSEGGAIALMSTTRLVYVSGNTQINSDFWTKYGFPKPNEPIPTLGEVFQKMKNRPPPYNSEDNKFALLGDASMPIAFPKHIIAVDSVNGKSISAYRDTVKAFSIITLKGHVNERLVGKFNKFNGTMWVKVFDKPSQKFTLNNDKSTLPVPFLEQSGVLFNGQVSVKNGEFQLVFRYPRTYPIIMGLGWPNFMPTMAKRMPQGLGNLSSGAAKWNQPGDEWSNCSFLYAGYYIY